MSDELLTTAEAAARLRLAPGHLENWRYRGEGPTYVKLGARVFYRPSDLAAFIKACEHAPERGPQAHARGLRRAS